jgi:hypothetical protein
LLFRISDAIDERDGNPGNGFVSTKWYTSALLLLTGPNAYIDRVQLRRTDENQGSSATCAFYHPLDGPAIPRPCLPT